MNASTASAVGYAEVGGTGCGCIAALVNASTASAVGYAEAATVRTCLAARWVLAWSASFSTMSYAKAAFFCILLTARWVFAPTTHHGKNTKLILYLFLAFSLLLPL